MSFPDFNINNPQTLTDRFCQLLWFDEKLGIWLDISRMHISSKELKTLADPIDKALLAIDALESGEIFNLDENRMVGHYWLRNSAIAPSKDIENQINTEISNVQSFANDILKGDIKSTNGKNFTNVVWIGIGGSGLGPQLIINSLKQYLNLRINIFGL